MNEIKNPSAAEMLDFINKSPSCFHVVQNIKELLTKNGFEELNEQDKWTLKKGGKYFTTKNSSAIISFVLPENDYRGFLISASHSDSPCFKIKENPEMKSAGIVKLNVEKYGGMLMNPWFDRPLSLAGRILVSEKSDSIQIKQKLVSFSENLLMIPNLAIHMNRDANEGHKINVQNELMPLISSDEKFNLKKLLAKQADVKEYEILGYDLFVCNNEKSVFWGENQEFIAGPRLDDLECVYTTLQGFINSENNTYAKVHCVFDNEEVGSQSRQGAASTFFYNVLQRINECSGKTNEDFIRSIASSFMVSADNAHAVHPNFNSSADPVNQPKVNCGPVIKFNAAQKYTTDGVSAAIFKKICNEAQVPYQIFTNNSNIAGGSTLGNISTTQVSVNSVDIGLAQWAMHSPYESAGALDVELMLKVMKFFYNITFDFNIA